MPYITQEDRRYVYDEQEQMPVGSLNYLITTTIDFWLKDNGVNYANINSVIGVLECAKLEAYRRVAAGYEDKKCAKNGDVYTCLGDK